MPKPYPTPYALRKPPNERTPRMREKGYGLYPQVTHMCYRSHMSERPRNDV